MSTLTKTQLIAALADMTAERDMLLNTVATLTELGHEVTAELASVKTTARDMILKARAQRDELAIELTAQLVEAKQVAANIKPAATKTAWVSKDIWLTQQAAKREQLNLAREEAMRTGRMVRA